LGSPGLMATVPSCFVAVAPSWMSSRKPALRFEGSNPPSRSARYSAYRFRIDGASQSVMLAA
jgi:hypothetical protein